LDRPVGAAKAASPAKLPKAMEKARTLANIFDMIDACKIKPSSGARFRGDAKEDAQLHS
jgi:hypothetical protein